MGPPETQRAEAWKVAQWWEVWNWGVGKGVLVENDRRKDRETGQGEGRGSEGQG